jgi:type II secretory pathway pseudopilin PulG
MITERVTQARIARSASRPRNGIHSEGGFTLIELMWAIVLTLVVVVGPLAFLVTSINQQNNISSRAFAARQAQTGLEQLTRDLRGAINQDSSGNTYSVTVSNPSSSTTSISFDIPGTATGATGPYGIIPDAVQVVTWTCPSTGASSIGSCTRTIGAVARTEIAGVVSATFTPNDSGGATMMLPATNPSYVGVTLSVQVTSQLDAGRTHRVIGIGNPILVQSGIDLRNQS